MKNKLLFTTTIFIVLTLIFGSQQALATPRTNVEICGNGIDEDGDGLRDDSSPYQDGGCILDATSSPVSDNGVVPELWTDNPNCTDLGYGFGFKLDGAPTGTFTLTSANGDLTSGAPQDPGNSVTVSSDGVYASWSSTVAVDAVFIKGGNEGGNLYVYNPESTGPDSGLATSTLQGISHIEFCYDYELDVSKDASTSFTRTYDWDIIKTPNADYVGFPGDTFPHEYTITVNRTGFTDSNWAVSGGILIENNTPFSATIEGVADVVSAGINAPVNCGVSFPHILTAGNSLLCSYTTALPDGTDRLNTATVTTSGVVGGNIGTADVLFGSATITEVNATVNVTDDNGTSSDNSDNSNFGPLADGDSVNYSRDFVCSSDPNDYTNGTYSDPPLVNTAEIDETGDSDDATVNLTCYAPVVSKTVTPAWEQDFQWDIVKNVDNTTFSGNPGDGWTFNYDIDVILTSYDEVNFFASGTISVQNPDPSNAMTVALSDAIGGFPAVISADADCNFDGTDLLIPAGQTATCDYTVDMGDAQDANKDVEYTNTATATIGGGDFVGTASFTFNDVSPTLAAGSEPADVTATDDNATPGDSGDDYTSTTISGSTEDALTYSQTGACPTDSTMYTNGVYEITLTNTADIVETDDTDTQTVTVTCYAPVVSKTAVPAWQQDYQWDIFKNVDNTTFTGSPGDGWTFNYDIDVQLTSYDELNFSASGIISVQNPDPSDPMTVTVSDAVTGVGSAVVDCDAGTDGNQNSLTVAAASTGECSYTIDMGNDLDGGQDVVYTNVATASISGANFTGNQTFKFADATPTLAAGSEPAEVTATDDNATPADDSDDHTSTTISGSTEDVLTYSQSGTCPTDISMYSSGVYEITFTNTADIVETDDTDFEIVTVRCETSFVDLLKLTNGAQNPDMTWTFQLSQNGATIETLSTPPALLDFQTTLVPGAEYTLCEVGIPPSWTAQWAVDANGNGVIDDGETLPFVGGTADLIGAGLWQVYDPDPAYGTDGAVNDTRCVNFLADSDAGDTVQFIVDNQRPGGDPRTPGYWKNWNTCTNGNQVTTAAENGGPSEGWFLLDDLIPTTIGDLTIATCEDGVNILDRRDLQNGRKRASDAAYNLASHLLAAKLNLAAGAETCSAVVDAVAAGDALLSSIDFDGKGRYLRPRNAEYQPALDIAATLDAYNNGLLCSP